MVSSRILSWHMGNFEYPRAGVLATEDGVEGREARRLMPRVIAADGNDRTGVGGAQRAPDGIGRAAGPRVRQRFVEKKRHGRVKNLQVEVPMQGVNNCNCVFGGGIAKEESRKEFGHEFRSV